MTNDRQISVWETFEQGLALVWSIRQPLARLIVCCALVLGSIDLIDAYWGNSKELHGQGSYEKSQTEGSGREFMGLIISTGLLLGVGLPVSLLFPFSCLNMMLINPGLANRFGFVIPKSQDLEYFKGEVEQYEMPVAKVFIVCIVVFLVVSIGLESAGFEIDEPSVLPGFSNLDLEMLVAVFLPLSYVAGRYGLILPALALKWRKPPEWAWELSVRNGWRLTCVFMIIPWAIYSFCEKLIWPELIQSPWAFPFANALTEFAVYAIGIGALSVAFQTLTRWSPEKKESSFYSKVSSTSSV